MSRKRVIGILLTGSLLLTSSIASAKKKKPAADAEEPEPTSHRAVAQRRCGVATRSLPDSGDR